MRRDPRAAVSREGSEREKKRIKRPILTLPSPPPPSHPLHLKVDLRVPLSNNVALAEAPPDRTLLFSHHEKVVVVDQRVAFCGASVRRWKSQAR